eukprot:CAMPEP_0174386022 /NCGR_PEP_ID=MMETSP0811_2-20130205/126996_1 /TAXON_ID=73025 ORGANISM="Eutreptiella gymnastica-like, Strain CCMP1594" /NCGR_SAMPLE_ID=MMETSP0811_2 /ASSEMBLY_ACC=CAM_ASM_000667 /LENGTH=85 /DNA_ID=CAMNT_0015540549 /DNA_START=1564 /DNA_END=1822 /DNA_ORIENTATION=-
MVIPIGGLRCAGVGSPGPGNLLSDSWATLCIAVLDPDMVPSLTGWGLAMAGGGKGVEHAAGAMWNAPPQEVRRALQWARGGPRTH